MKTNYLCLVLLSLCVLSSCASKKKMTREESLKAREEWLKFSQKEYKGISKEKIISAAEEVLNLTDGSDFNYSHNDDGFIGKRNWLVYAVLAAASGTDTWEFTVKPKGENLVATFHVTTAGSAISGTVTGSGDTTTFTTPSQDSIVQGNAIYHMFWGRMDYVLGITKTWPDCNSVKVKIKKGELNGDLENICDSVTITDELPKGLTDDELNRIFLGDKYKIGSYKKNAQATRD